jgi:hypothetical protein
MEAQKFTRSGDHQLEDGLMADSCAHRKLGLWAIETVNPNSWAGGARYLEFTAADAVLFQETKLREEDARRSAEDSALNGGWEVSLSKAVVGERGGASAGVGFAIRRHLGLAKADVETDPDIQARFALKKLGAVCKGGIHVGSVYLYDTVGPTDQRNREILEKIAFTLLNVAGSWVIGGDWNCTPDELRATGWLSLIGAEIQAPKDPTCNEKCYDYFVVKKDLCGAVYAVHTIADGIFHPHSPVRLFLRAAPRAMKIRALISPGSFQAALPFGPATRQQQEEAQQAKDIACRKDGQHCDIQSEAATLVDLMEKQLVCMSGFEGKQAVSHSGRTQGPQVKLRCPMQIANGTKKTTPAMRAWKATWKWLGNLLLQKTSSTEAG